VCVPSVGGRGGGGGVYGEGAAGEGEQGVVVGYGEEHPRGGLCEGQLGRLVHRHEEVVTPPASRPTRSHQRALDICLETHATRPSEAAADCARAGRV
jgi:hypothetical protein